jgi:hypothetical protein
MSIELPISVPAKPRLERRASRRTHSLLLAFAILFSVALVSGFYYYLVPHGANWAASQVVLVLHIISGTLAFIPFIPYVIVHQRDEEGRSLFLIAPWLAFRRREGESAWRHRQRLLGHALGWSILVLSLSGAFVILPGLLWYAGVVWLLDYLVYQVANAIHLGVTFVVVGLALLHFTGRRNGGND